MSPAHPPVRLQPLTRARVADLGEAGARWQAGLPATLDDLAARWDLAWGRPVPGGSASYVVRARTRAGAERVVKVVLPDPTLADEARVLAAADGHGYVLLHDRAPEHSALLLESLGDPLDRLPADPEHKLRVALGVLAEAWQLPAGAATGEADPAPRLRAGVVERDRRLGRPTDPRVLRTALDCADEVAGWAGPRVVAHGDPHPANVLRVREPRPGAPGGWVLVDPDGVLADPAYDVGVLLRDWCSHLRGPDAHRRLRHWCDLAAEATGTDADRVWAWAFLERVSTGLYVSDFGATRVGRPFLDSARALL